MTKERKRLLKEVLETLKNQALILEEISGEEQDIYDDHDSSWQDSEKGEENQITVSMLEQATGAVYEAIELVEEL